MSATDMTAPLAPTDEGLRLVLPGKRVAAVRNAILASIGGVVIGALVAMALVIPLIAALWFAPALVYMHDMAPLAAMKASLGASFRNFVPFLLYGIVMLVLAIVAVIPFG